MDGHPGDGDDDDKRVYLSLAHLAHLCDLLYSAQRRLRRIDAMLVRTRAMWCATGFAAGSIVTALGIWSVETWR